VSFIGITTIAGAAGAAVCVGVADAVGCVAEVVADAGVEAVALGVVAVPPSVLPPPHATISAHIEKYFVAAFIDALP